MVMATSPVREMPGHGMLDGVVLREPAVLAVSGGGDSMLMASVLAERAPSQLRAIATFDHGTGTRAHESTALVERWAVAHGIPVRVGRAHGLRATEAAWRSARWAFLREVSREFAAPVATAHTEDDQAETVFIRLLRHSGVRGLAGLRAPGPVRRPLLALSRASIRELIATRQVPFVEDPSNRDLRHLRNRVRHELLPAAERVAPGFRTWLLRIGENAAAWRRTVASAVDEHWAPRIAADEQRLTVHRDRRRRPDAAEASLFWPEVAGRIGVTLDRRGTARLASFSTTQASGLWMPLSGGAIVRAARDCWTLERGSGTGAGGAPSDRRAPRHG